MFTFDAINLSQLQLLRPWWLLALVPLVLLLVWLVRHHRGAGSWRSEVDPQLLPYLISEGETGKRRLGLIAIALAGLLGVLAMAGPVWKQLPQPVFSQQSALVVALDLSRSMDATDIAPSRLARARHKVIDILKKRREGQTALLVYAARPFVVTPLTDDTQTILSQVSALSTELMPSQGSRPDLAARRAAELFQGAGIANGDLLLITDGLPGHLLESLPEGLRISVLAVGTPEGAPIPAGQGGFLKDASGQIVMPRLNPEETRRWAAVGSGRYHRITDDDTDIDQLLAGIDGAGSDAAEELSGLQSDRWREEGPWLLLLILPLAAIAFRRGVLLVVGVLLLPLPESGHAAALADLFFTPDQQGERMLQQGDPQGAAQRFADPEWKAAAHYRAGEYEAAVEALQEVPGARAHYNRGNALAQAGRLQEALEAYEQALEEAPDDADAQHNRELVEEVLQQQEQQQQQNGGSSDEGGEEGEEGEGSEEGDSPPQGDSGEGNQQGDQAGEPPPQGESDSTQESTQEKSDEGSQGEPGEESGDSAPPEAAGQDSAQQADDAPTPEPGAGEETPEGEDGEEGEEASRATGEAGEEQAEAGDEPTPADSQAQSEEERATEQWLRRIPDDPAGLLRRKFRYQYQQAYGGEGEAQGW